MRMAPGSPWPLGAELVPEGVNFAVWAPDATRLEVCLFDAEGTQELVRHALPVCTDGVWHGCLVGAAAGLVYGLRAHGPWDLAQGHRFNPAKVLLDPWAKSVVGRYGGTPDADLSLYLGHSEADPALPDTRDNAAVALKARVLSPAPIVDAAERPHCSADRTVLCELHVRSATMLHPQIPAALRGSYAALAHPAMLDHWRSLGVTSLSLLPVHARADEARLQQQGLSNHWGYSSIAFLAPEPRYWSGRPGTTPESECREMVHAAHAAGLEVVLDVVFNHTGETDECGPTLSMRGLANARYYHLDPQRRDRYVNWTGCGNCLNLAEPRVVELVLGSLRHWVQAYGVDGFRFDLAPVLARGRDGQFSAAAGFFAALQSDPVLSRTKLIAEPWDIGPGGYQLGGFPPGWSEWNDQYRDTLRAWWLRGGGDRGVFAHRFAGSSAQFHHDRRQPTASVNFITAHDGFTLRDLVTYDHKHNHANGEHNRDGHHHNSSWNCGVEGETADPAVRALRLRLQRALLATLLLSQGTPMLLAGDEIGHSQQGNNNAYCQDNALSWLDWAGQDTDLLATTRRLLTLRRDCPALRIGQWLTGQPDAHGRTDVVWLHPDGHRLADADWRSVTDRALLVHLHAAAGPQVLLVFNPETDDRRCQLPADIDWQLVFDSARPAAEPPPARATPGTTVVCSARSVLMLRSR